jgi:pyruvate dehydrogenase E2 component (dihydrolipoamide acetyltransferase)
VATEVIIPKVDMVMETGTFIEWLKQEGDHVSKGDPIFVITTDKAAIEVEATADGLLTGLTAQAGDVIPVAGVIAYILAPGEVVPTKAVVTAAQDDKPALTPSTTEAAPAEVPGTPVIEPAEIGKVRASPVARRLAQDLGMDLTQLSGRGPRGRIHKADVLAYQESHPLDQNLSASRVALKDAVPASPTLPKPNGQFVPVPLPDARQKQVVPLAGARKIIAERMAYSAFSAPHITLSLRVDMTEAIRLRERVLEPIQAQTGQRVSFTAILARAIATVLPYHPYLNASLSDGSIILWDDIHLGIATSVEESLIVPVIREAQNQNLERIVATMADLTERARNRRLTPAEMTGSTFTISNLGMFGIESFTAIINPPESAILAVGKMVDTPVRSADSFVFRPMIQLTVSADHRIVDGASVARFLDQLKSTLENPYLLI